MRRLNLIVMSLFLSFAFISCSKNPSDVLGTVQDYYKSGKYDDVKKFYSKGSIKAIDELEKLVPKSKSKEEKIDKKFAKGAKWEVVSEKINNDRAEVKVKYIEHPIENMKGLELKFNMKKENNTWKIDIENEIRSSIEMIKGMNEKMNFFKR